jgi:hypothetical protein
MAIERGPKVDVDADEDAMLALLVELHRRNQQPPRGPRDPGARARIVEHFERRGQRLRGERLVTAELIERLYQGGAALPPARPQQEIALEGPAGGRAAGRLRVTNRSAETARFDLVVGEPVEGGPLPVHFQPAHGALAPGASVLVRVEADLAGWRGGDRATLPVECRWRAGADRAWLSVVARPRAAEGGHEQR